ncbi:acyltransferase [Bacteroides fragilis]|nr:acyltransferase [Bacteroides fragilis]
MSKLGFVIASFFTERRYGQCKRIKYYLFSKIVMHWFKSTGKHIRICPPLFVNGGKYVTIGDNFSMLERARIEAIDCYTTQTFKPEIIIGNNVVINSDCHLGAINTICIDDNVVIASRVYISDHFHGKLDASDLLIDVAQRDLYSKGGIHIEKNVWIGEGACIMPWSNNWCKFCYWCKLCCNEGYTTKLYSGRSSL